MNKLVKELNQELGIKNDRRVSTESVHNLSTSSSILNQFRAHLLMQEVKNWSNSRVIEWLHETNICIDIQDQLSDFDGQMLHELNSIRKESPEYFFNMISRNSTVNLFNVVNFSHQFKLLFQK